MKDIGFISASLYSSYSFILLTTCSLKQLLLYYVFKVSGVSPVILKFIQVSCRMQEMSSIWRLKWVMLIIFAKERFGASGTALIPHMDLLPFLLDLVWDHIGNAFSFRVSKFYDHLLDKISTVLYVIFVSFPPDIKALKMITVYLILEIVLRILCFP